MKKHRYLFIALLCLLSLFGCTRAKIIDKLSIIHVFGFDLAKDGELIGTALYPNYLKKKGDEEVEILKEKSIGTMFPQKMSNFTSTPVELAKIRVLVFGKQYAEQGIQEMVKRFILLPEIGTNIQIAVSEQSAQKTLEVFRKKGELTLADQIKQNMLTKSLPEINLHLFLNHLYGEGMDPFVPFIRVTNDKIEVDGVGIFKDAKFKLHLNAKQTFFFAILENKRMEGATEMEIEEKGRKGVATVHAFESKKKWKLKDDKQQPEMNLTLNLEWRIAEAPDWIDIKRGKDLELLKSIIAKDVKKGVEDVLAIFKENGVDPVGIGNFVRSQDKNWDEKSFYQSYPDFPIHVNVNLEIIHAGLET